MSDTDTLIPIETILRPAFVAPEQISEAVFAANLGFAKEHAHYEATFRSMYSAAERVMNGTSKDPADAVTLSFFTLVVGMGPTFARNIVQFQLPKKIGVPKEDEVPTWINAARREFCLAARNAIYAAQGDIHDRIKSGDVKSQGLPDGLSRDEFFWETVRACGTPSTQLMVDDVEYPGLSEDMKGKTCGVQFGWYANSHRTLGKAAKEKLAAKAAAANGTTEKPAETAPAPEAK